jgi:hypothetical protein
MHLDTALKYSEDCLCRLDDSGRRNGFVSPLVTAIEMADEMGV